MNNLQEQLNKIQQEIEIKGYDPILYTERDHLLLQLYPNRGFDDWINELGYIPGTRNYDQFSFHMLKNYPLL